MLIKRKLKSLSFLLIASLSVSNQVYSQNPQTNERINPITTAVPFLLIAPDSRAGGMGDIGIATSPDANSMRWNAAKLAFSEKEMGFSLSYIPWLRQLVNDINLSYLSGFKKIDKDQTIGASLFYSSLGQVTFTDEQGLTIGDFRPHEFAFDVSYARRLAEKLSGGVALRYIYSNLTLGQFVQGAQTKPGMSIAGDVTLYYQNKDIELGKIPAEYAFGVAFRNIGSKMSYSETERRDFIPMNIGIGNALTLKPDDYNKITFAVDLNKLMVPTPALYDGAGRNPSNIVAGRDNNVGVVAGMFGSFNDAPGVLNDDGSRSVAKEEFREINISAGMEYWYDDQFAFRAGYFHEHATKGNRKYITFGAGLRYNVFGLDVAYLVATEQRHPLGNTIRFTLLFDFAALPNKEN
jgi:hypothetical protein